MGVAQKNYAKLSYVVMDLLFMCVSIGVMYALTPLANKYGWTHCEYHSTTSDCFGQISVLRMSFALVVFHCLMLLLLVPRAKVCGVIHDGFWPVKYLLVAGIYVGAWFLPQHFFLVWGQICRAFSILFLFVQAYFLMNLAYSWNDYLLAAISGREGECYAKFLLIAFSVISTGGSVVWLVYCFIWYFGCSV
jgi:serine incorporator 1/3